MKVSGKYSCVCEACLKAQKRTVSECDLHLFVGMYRSNYECDLEEFEYGINFAKVLHWDVGFTQDARYFVYRDGEGNMVAWYDKINQAGFKAES